MIKFNRLSLTLVSLGVMIISGLLFWFERNNQLVVKPEEGATLRYESLSQPKLNQAYVVRVVADSKRDNINSAGIYLRFDPQKLRVSELDTLQSFCQFYPEKKFDNQLGSISLACGAPHPGVRGEVEIMRITFLPLVESNSQVLLDSKSVLLRSDGVGTNLLKEYPWLEVSPGVSL